jgi:hypothetical protein
VKVWLVKRRNFGVEVPRTNAAVMASETAPVELIVKTGTDQGLRQPGKVARIYEVGYPRLLAELERPKLVWMQRTGLILSGIERHINERKEVVRFSQTWMCVFSPPFDTCEMRVSERIDRGMQVHRSRVKETGDSGHVAFKQEYIEGLGRHSFVAMLVAEGGTERRRLLDADIEWMGPDRFALEGLNRTPAYHDMPEVLHDGGWLCMFRRPREPEPGKRRSSFERAMRG